MEADPEGPEGFQVDAFGVGVAKAATTWMAACLDEHPDVTVSEPKEPKFFAPQLGFDLEMRPNEGFLDDWDWYRSTFAHAGPGDVLVDYTLALFWNEHEGAGVVRQHNEEAKLIFMLRDPAERLHSAYWHRRRHESRDPSMSFETFATQDEALRRSSYARLLEPWFETFPREQIFVGLDLDLRSDPADLYASACRFLGVDDTVRPPSLEERVNPQTRKRPTLRVLEKLARTVHDLGGGPLLDAVNRVGLGEAIKETGTEVVDRPDPDPSTMAELRERLRPQIEATEAMLDRDLSAWKDEA